jgi:hypothetical protein
MIAIAIVAVLIWGEKMRRLRVIYLERAAAYKREAELWLRGVKMSEAEVASNRASLAKYEREAADVEADPGIRRRAKESAELDRWSVNHSLVEFNNRTNYYTEARRLEHKYERAAKYPWQPITLDPPPPW